MHTHIEDDIVSSLIDVRARAKKWSEVGKGFHISEEVIETLSKSSCERASTEPEVLSSRTMNPLYLLTVFLPSEPATALKSSADNPGPCIFQIIINYLKTALVIDWETSLQYFNPIYLLNLFILYLLWCSHL